MLPVTHILAPVVLLAAVDRWTDASFTDRELVLAGTAGILPDLLNIHITLAERASISHSLLILLPLIAGYLLLDGRYRRYAGIVTLGFGTHIVLDIVSAPYNFLYPLQFDPSYPTFGCRLAWWMCWYAVDIVLAVALLLLTYTPLHSPD